ncbi:hypothetical protein [uncultured Chryseobacterium sp.]|jgi:hypothetical protein|uniref:hypothetical protein n=1 Tax=uncultured Chryseobacterium sp. TaxID=259322 RepID=UPI002624951C|nr:hypothetical protein [uncultured Chryseobacterium sp.]
MVDVIKFYVADVELNENVKKKFSRFYKTRNNKEYCYYKKLKYNDIDDVDDFNKDRLEYEHFSIKFLRIVGENKGKLWFQQNIRKDYFARKEFGNVESAMGDLNFSQFEEEINFWADEFELDREVFWNAKITQIELGVTLEFNMPMKGIFSCFGSLKNLPRKHIYENSGVKFIGDNYQVSIYDKLDRTFSKGEILGSMNYVRRDNFKKILKNKKAYIRYEIKISAISGNLPKDFGDLDFLYNVRVRWNDLGKLLYTKFNDFTFVNILSPAIEKKIIYDQLQNKVKGEKKRGKNKTPIDHYLQFLGLQKIKMDQFRQYIIPFLKRDQRQIEQEYIDIYESFLKNVKPTYSTMFRTQLKKRLKKIKR